ncbi:MAG: porin family protein [Candidatus Limimorpha sp.]
MRKNVLLLAALLLAVSVNLSAQYKEFGFGVKLGPTFEWAGSKNNTVQNEATRAGFKWGVFGEYYFAENYAIVAGLNGNHLRDSYSFSDKMLLNRDTLSGTISRNFKGMYLEIPVMLKMRTEEFGDFQFFAEFGAGLGLRRRAWVQDEFKVSNSNIQQTSTEYVAVPKQYNPLRCNLLVAAGAEYMIKGSTRAFANLTYSRDLVNGFSIPFRNNYITEADRVTKLDLRRNIIGIEVGILF